MSAPLKPGPELDERVCRALGWGPTKGWDDPEQRYPAVSTDGNAMLRAIEAMRERRWILFRAGYYPKGGCAAIFKTFEGQVVDCDGDTLPHAVALAILAALEDKAEVDA